LSVGFGLLDVQGGQYFGLFAVDGGYADHRCGAVDADAVALNAAQLRHGPLGAEFALGQLEPVVHDPVQDQRHEASGFSHSLCL
jgi:hypothetical protein